MTVGYRAERSLGIGVWTIMSQIQVLRKAAASFGGWRWKESQVRVERRKGKGRDRQMVIRGWQTVTETKHERETGHERDRRRRKDDGGSH